MEKYLTFISDLARLIKDHFSIVLSSLSIIISCLTFFFSMRDRKNHVKIELMTDAEFVKKYCKNIRNNSFMEGWLYIIVRNTGRTNIYVDSVWCKLFPTAKEFEFISPYGGTIVRDEFGKIVTTGRADSLILPFRSQIYFCSFSAHPCTPDTDKFSVTPYVSLQSGLIEKGHIRHFHKEDLYS